MTPNTYREIQLANRPEGTPTDNDFNFVEKEIPAIGAEELLLKTLYLSVDPYMRGRMKDQKSYVAPFELNKAISGGIVAEVIESKSEHFTQGDIVTGSMDWAEYNAVEAKSVQKVDPSIAPISTRLGVLGLTGLTAYFGLLDIGKPQEGETVVVSGAAGAVGSIVGQIAKLKGAHVVGIAGSQEKIDYLINDLGFDEAVNYKDDNFKEAFKKTIPNGIDVYFDNVGGEVSDAVIVEINRNARVVLCGAISAYNNPEADIGPRIQWKFITTSSMMKGFTLGDYAHDFKTGAQELGKWLQEGKLKYEETITEGFDNTPKAFLGLFDGSNLGKQLVKVADPDFAQL